MSDDPARATRRFVLGSVEEALKATCSVPAPMVVLATRKKRRRPACVNHAGLMPPFARVLALFRLPLAQPDAWTAAVLLDELDAG
jgi:hypothetical protein